MIPACPIGQLTYDAGTRAYSCDVAPGWWLLFAGLTLVLFALIGWYFMTRHHTHTHDHDDCSPCDSDQSLERRILAIVEELLHILRRDVTGFMISQISNNPNARRSTTAMPITGIKVGATGTFAETPLPPGSTLPAGVVPTWTSSDPANAPVTPAADGLTASVAIAAGATITGFDLSVQATLPDGSTPAGKVTVPVLAPTVTGFQIDQTA